MTLFSPSEINCQYKYNTNSTTGSRSILRSFQVVVCCFDLNTLIYSKTFLVTTMLSFLSFLTSNNIINVNYIITCGTHPLPPILIHHVLHPYYELFDKWIYQYSKQFVLMDIF